MCWKAEYAILILISTVVNYLAGMMIPKAKSQNIKVLLLCSALSVSLGILFFFKYFTFIGRSIEESFRVLGLVVDIPSFDWLLPVGISFFTFQTLSYTIDVYRGRVPAERHFGIFALYVSFFPQLVAGPIERSSRLLPQFYTKKEPEPNRFTSGSRLILWGLFKKILIADNLAIVVDTIYNNPGEHSGFHLVIATYCFTFQIFCDFSGYSDIAIGSARILGIDLMENFKRPYFAKNVSDFWNRWHISLSSWFRDYLYIPLGGSRVSPQRKVYRNILAVFLLSGLWHGANWTFLMWGGVHALYLMVYRMGKSYWVQIWALIARVSSAKTSMWASRILTFHLVVFAWIFFRANNVEQAFFVIGKIFSDWSNLSFREVAFDRNNILLPIVGSLIVYFVHRKQECGGLSVWLNSLHKPLRWAMYTALFWAILVWGNFGKQQFIYFVF
jgi:D-alanyl-lipoteichoic acid acyltransferase DltB (MBOAT superfamily)